MAFTKKYVTNAPADPETKLNIRQSMEYYMTFPDNYCEKNKYGIVFSIPGFGDLADSIYQLEKLCPYISDKYNYIVVGLRYHNDCRINPNSIKNINPDNFKKFYYNINEGFLSKNMNGNEAIEKIFEMLIQKDILSLDPRLAIQTNAYHNYSSFGFLPAIEHLYVLFDILNNFNIDKQNIIAFGSSYGGYIASLMAKFAPQTFSMIIDNSGFCLTFLQDVYGSKIGGLSGATTKYHNGKRYEIPFSVDTIWSLDETSSYYFSDAHRQIRNLLLEDHRTSSKTLHCCFHSVDDELVPISQKDMLYNMLNKYCPTYYRRIDKKELDGSIFKDLSHGMNASLRGIFDISYQEYTKYANKQDTSIDYDSDISYGFPCSDKLYTFSYSPNGLNISIDKLRLY